MMRKLDIAGKTFGMLTAIKEQSGLKNHSWEFSCTCGVVKIIQKGNVISGHTKSCGCLRKRKSKEHPLYKYGAKTSKEYESWAGAKSRCFDTNNKSYAKYGAAGISMSDEFKDSFEVFINHLGEMPKDGKRYTLGRIDNDVGYVRGNLRWETSYQQARNKGIQKNNSTGKSGVIWDTKKYQGGENLYAKAIWHDVDGIQRNKIFSVKKLGLLPAFAEAVKYREKMIAELNAQGAGYSDKHGK